MNTLTLLNRGLKYKEDYQVKSVPKSHFTVQQSFYRVTAPRMFNTALIIQNEETSNRWSNCNRNVELFFFSCILMIVEN